MKSFKQYVEAMQQTTFKNTDRMGHILSDVTSHKDMVKFVIFCVKDVASTVPSNTYESRIVKLGIGILESWLTADEKERKEINQSLTEIANNVSREFDVNKVTYAMRTLANACFCAVTDDENGFKLYGSHTAQYASLVNPRKEHIYKALANSLKANSNLSRQPTEFLQNDTASVAALADYLQELPEEERIELIQQIPNGFKLNLNHFEITGKTYPELLQNIVNNKEAMFALKRIFG